MNKGLLRFWINELIDEIDKQERALDLLKTRKEFLDTMFEEETEDASN